MLLFVVFQDCSVYLKLIMLMLPQCDETKPECKNCTQYGKRLPCVYKDTSHPGTTLQAATPSSTQSLVTYNQHNATSTSSFDISIPNLPDITNDEHLFAPSPRSALIHNELCTTCGCWHPRAQKSLYSDQLPGILPGCALIKIFPNIANVESQNTGNDGKDKNLLPNYSEADLFLLNHFISHTWETMSVSPNDDQDTRHVWAQVVPTLSLAHPLLFHSMLTVTAAHLAHTPASQPRTNLMELKKLEENHFGEAMNYFGHEILSGIDELSCHAVFAATCAFVLYLISPRRHPISIRSNSTPTTPRPLDTTWAYFFRALYGALQHSWPWLVQGPIARLVDDLLPARTSTQTLSLKAESVLARLTLLHSDFNILGPNSAAEMADRSTASAYYDAVWNIRMTWAIMEWYCASIHLEPVDSGEILCALFQFLLQTPPRFWERLESGSPRALIIYSYFTVCWEALSYNTENKLPFSFPIACPEAGNCAESDKNEEQT